jgi:NADPH:quinone reductase-like Zn-dependent oxidoreductase
MRAIVLTALGDSDNLKLEQRPDPQPGPGEVLVRLHAAALNRRDVWIRKGQYAGIKLPIILGSDGAGEVMDVGEGVDRASWKGRQVVIDPSLNWGGDDRAQDNAFNILGLPKDGTYAEMVVVPAANLHAKPAHLSWEEAAAVPLASVTAYRALVTRARVQAGETVLVTGIGGGVATCALQIARHLGANVYVTSGHESKIEAAKRLGAMGGVNHRKDDWAKTLVAEAGSRPDVIIDGAGGDTFNRALDALKPGGRLVSYGSTAGAAQNVEVRRIFWKQLNVLGSTMGSPSDFAAMLQLYEAGLKPVVDKVFPLEQAGDAHIRMEAGDQFGKIVLKTSSV